jgi:type I restriction enzyme S subunit
MALETALRGRYRAYPEYKDSGVEWLGKVPKYWGVANISKISNKITNGYVGPTRGLFQDGGIRYLQSLHIKQNKISFHTPYFVTKEWSDEKGKSILKEGDVLVVQTGDIGQVAAVTKDFEGCNCHALIIISTTEKIDGFYLSWLLNSDYGFHRLKSIQTGALHPHLNCDTVKTVKTPIPQMIEQQKIANFLDHETAKIDTLIDKQQQLITLLKEKRQAVISHAVTKGLNPKAPMRDSGVEWLGEVPEHWELPKLIHRTSRIGDGLHSTPKYQDNTGYYFVNGNNLVNGHISVGATAKEVPEEEYKSHYVHLDESSVMLSINGTIGNVARFNGEKIILGKSAAYMNCSGDLLPEYLMLYLQSSQALRYFDLEVTGTTIFNLSLNSIRQMKVCIPFVTEQIEIDEYCKFQKDKYDALINKARSAIALMQERRTALISAAVTGKIDVRNWQAPATTNNNKEVAA